MNKKKKVVKTIKIFWTLLGIILASAILFSFVKIQIAKGDGEAVKTLFFAAGLYAFIIYLISTTILILLQEIIKRIRGL
jgi:DNA integrity scanning protein DisA with diadenylate cyclase activity